MITSGIIIIMGFVFLLVKLPRRTVLKLLGWPITLDLGVTVLAYVLHWGTFTGVMAAAFAGMMCSVITTVARWSIGYIRGGKLYPGKFTVKGINR